MGPTRPNPLSDQIQLLRNAFAESLRRDERPRIENFVAEIEGVDLRLAVCELVRIEVAHQRATHDEPELSEYIHRFPDLAEDVAEAFAEAAGLQSVESTANRQAPPEDTQGFRITSPAPASTGTLERIGRYEIRRELGAGGFGKVFLAHDQQLDRLVALKVPNERMFNSGMSADAFLQEARSAARVNHPRLVAVYDAQLDGGQVYVVQEYVDGVNLAEWMRSRESGVATHDAVRMVRDISEGLAAAHAAGLVHRDLKPANILVDSSGEPHVADFGLALRAGSQSEHEGEVSGTPRYMSPEQVRGESHLLDGRSDLWSLGVIFYQLLVGTRPFQGSTRRELFRDIQQRDPRPPSMVRPNAQIDAELERICLKCLRKRASDRYTSALRLIDDLQHWLDAHEKTVTPHSAVRQQAATTAATIDQIDSVPRVVPKGLRSFDAGDADFFLELLPGPRDRRGLPDSIRFWKSHFEQTDPEETFRVGLIYGPSGCGKSSLVKAGLMPHLNGVIPIYIEATPDETEQRLRKGIARRCSIRDHEAELADIVRRLRERSPTEPKVVLIIDQFEQWLYAHRDEPHTQLVNALRQCDGGHVQCVLMVRDDFWMAISQFMGQVEIPIESRNSAAVDLFDLPHARKVLVSLGRAFGQLPQASENELPAEQEQFVEQAVDELSQDGKVVCVRLALFADMMKSRPWTPTELRQVGGTEGVGATFLEETFGAATAPPQHRLHQHASRQILAALLPATGAEIKGHMRSSKELLTAAGYIGREAEFANLLNILDRDLRLITPTDPDAILDTGDSISSISAASGETWYQLTHDYLVPSLREWLNRKQKETRRGRAELQLADRTQLWSSKQESRQLPSVWEYLNLRMLTDRSKWNAEQERMMRSATRFHTLRAACVAAVLAVVVFSAVRIRSRIQAQSLVAQLGTAKPTEVSAISAALQPHMVTARPILRELVDQNTETPKQAQQQLHARIALAATDKTQVEPLIQSLLSAHPDNVRMITDALRPYSKTISGELWAVLSDERGGPDERFRAALALANYDAESEKWFLFAEFVVHRLVDSNPEQQPGLRQQLRPIRASLLPALETIFRQPEGTETKLLASASALADYIENDDLQVADLLVEATPKQYEIIWQRLAGSADAKLAGFLKDLMRQEPSGELDPEERRILGRRRAGAAITRVRQGARSAVPVLDFTDDREAMTQFIHRLRSLGVAAADVTDIYDQFRNEKPTTRYGLLMALGEFQLTEIPQQHRARLIADLTDCYARDPSSGIHSASGWLLRKWGQAEAVRLNDEIPVAYSSKRQWFNVVIDSKVPEVTEESDEKDETSTESTDADAKPAKLLPAKFSLTFVVFQPGTFTFGSPPNEPARGSDEDLHEATITQPFAVLDREITFREMLACQQAGTLKYDYETVFPGYGSNMQSPVMAVSWYDAVRFCRWLTTEAGMPESSQCYVDPAAIDPAKVPTDERGEAPRNWPLDRSKNGFRLPTEHEWEVAARGGTKTMYEFGGDMNLVEHYGWFVEPSQRLLHAPKTLRPSSRGLFDMHGNVWEWCADWYIEDPSTGTAEDPIGPSEGKYRVYRGGGWAQDRTKLRSADRRLHDPVTRGNDLGFRIVIRPSSTE